MSDRNPTQRGGDPVVDEIRAIRARYWQQAGATGAGYLRLMRELAEQRQASRDATEKARRRKSG